MPFGAVKAGMVWVTVPEPTVETVRVFEVTENVAVTVQLTVMAPVVYVVPTREPEQPEAEAVYPAFGVTVKVLVLLCTTPVYEAGEMVPPAFAEVETVYPLTVTFVPPPQLLPSFDSVMVPRFADELLSAHARTE